MLRLHISVVVDGFVELCEDFFKLEDDLDLLDKQVHDTYFWERVRFPVHERLRRSLVDDRNDHNTTNSREYLSGGWLLLRNVFSRNPFLSETADLLFYNTGRRKKFEDGLWWDLYHDPVIESATDDCLLWERPYNVSHPTPAKTSDIRYLDLVEYTVKVLEKLGISTVSFSENERDTIADITDEITSRFGVHIPLLSLVTADLSKRKMQLPIYRKLIRRVDPDIAFLTVSYNGRETFVEASQREDVPVVELQHGAISRYHLAYSFPHDEKHVFPDYFFTFGDFWSELVDFPVPDQRVRSVGYPYLEMEAGKYDDVETREQTVFISQSSIGEELSQFAIELNDRKAYDNDIVYKLHPQEYNSWKRRYPRLANADLQVVDSDDPPLYRLFAESAAQVGVGSTALYEGLNFGLDTYVLDIPSEKHKLEYLVESGYAELVSAPDMLLDRSKADGGRGFDIEAIFKSNALENIANAVDEIRSKEQ